MQPFSLPVLPARARHGLQDGRQRSRLYRGHSEVSQLVKVIELGSEQNVQGRKSGHSILSWSSSQSDGAYPRRYQGWMRHFNRFFIWRRVRHWLRRGMGSGIGVGSVGTGSDWRVFMNCSASSMLISSSSFFVDPFRVVAGERQAKSRLLSRRRTNQLCYAVIQKRK